MVARQRHMRTAELIQIIAFAYFAALAWLRRLPAGRRALITAEALAAAAALTLLSIAGKHGSLFVSVVRDWLLAALMLVTYWTSGLFVTTYNERFQSALSRFDRRVLPRRPLSPIPSQVLELFYLLCYVQVPLGLGVLYLLRLGRYADPYWTVVLPAAYVCYGAVPFLTALPPRLDPKDPFPVPAGALRRLNLWVLNRGSIQVNTFPSAHVAATGAAALAVYHFAPAVGPLFLLVAMGVALGAVYGRYHYAADAIVGAAVALVSYAVSFAGS